MSATVKRQLIVNVFGTFGYISLILQWLWVSVLFLPQLFENNTIKDFFMPPGDVSAIPHFEFHTPPFLAIVLAVIITAAVLVVTVIVLVRLPTAISRGGKKATHKSAEKIIPIITHNHKVSLQKKQQLTIQTMRILKFVFTLLPFLLLLLVTFIPAELPDEIVMFVGAFLALGTLLWFSLEYGLARILKVKPMKLV